MSDDLVNIEVNGVPVKARKGQMIIQATDAVDAYVPRFCYHEKLSIAANCRMCLVEVEKAPKPLPACATPVAEGMKVFTKSPKAIAAQKATMEFLLINHPLDCPICDQGGECELQDLAQGFGRDVSRFAERKRVVRDKNLGPLISTDMTRCIHCTRCVRFTSEIAGMQELGTTGRGENTEIGTWIERSVDHELSGNVIDLCPVGALNSKPFRYRGRSWEMTQHPLVSPHDAVGSNTFGHVLRGRLMRIVPRANDAVNEAWISDRDRFSYEGVYSDDRLEQPMVKTAEGWQAVDWEEALTTAADRLKAGARSAAGIGALAVPTATTEELYLLGRVLRGLGSSNIDTRLRQQDFRDQAADPAVPGLGMPLAEVDQLRGLLVIGCDLRREAPVLAHRVRKAALRGARIGFVNPDRFEYLFPVAAYRVAEGARLLAAVAGVIRAAVDAGASAPAFIAPLINGIAASDDDRAVLASLQAEGSRAVLLGALAQRHPAYADLRAAAGALAAMTGATLSYLPEGGNAVGAALAGALPHRAAAGAVVAGSGLDARRMLERPLGTYVLFGGVEPESDSIVGEALQTLSSADCVIAITPYATDATRAVADILLPLGTFAETSGTYINVEGRWQSFTGAARPVGQSRPGWKILRVLGNLLGLAGFEYASSEEVRDELKSLVDAAGGEAVARDTAYRGQHLADGSLAGPTVNVPMYQADAIVRRAPALQLTRDGGARQVAC